MRCLWPFEWQAFQGTPPALFLLGRPEGLGMSKRHMEDHEYDAMVDLIRCRREEIAPELPENSPPGPKWKAKQGLNRLNLNGAEHDVMGCLVDRASSKSGLCYPSEEFIQGWTGRPMRTVQRAIRSLWDKRLINITRRSVTSNRYFIQWTTLFAAYKQQKAFERGVTLASRRRHRKKWRIRYQKWRITLQKWRLNLVTMNL